MNWICKTLLICLSFNPVMDYTNNDEFIDDVRACALHLNSMYSEEERVPINLVVAQSIHESNWGKSRFAVEGNNLLGIRTFDSADDQLKPLNKPNATWGLRIFETKCESISYYIELLNNNHHYKEFREERIMQHFSDEIDLEKLAMTLAIYAEDVYYSQKIIRTIRELEAYDRD
jgi:Bax protein